MFFRGFFKNINIRCYQNEVSLVLREVTPQIFRKTMIICSFTSFLVFNRLFRNIGKESFSGFTSGSIKKEILVNFGHALRKMEKTFPVFPHLDEHVRRRGQLRMIDFIILGFNCAVVGFVDQASIQ